MLTAYVTISLTQERLDLKFITFIIVDLKFKKC